MLANKKYLSIQMGQDKIRITHLLKGKNKVTIYHAIDLPLPEGSMEDGQIAHMEILSKQLMDVLKENKIHTKDVIFSIYHPRIITREVDLPALPAAKLQKLIQANVGDYFPVDITGYLVGHKVTETRVEQSIKKSKVMLLAIPEKIMSQYVVLCDLLKLNMMGIDYQENSVLHFMQLQKLPDTHMLIHMDGEATTVAIEQGEKLAFFKTMPIGTIQFIQAIKNQYRIATEEATKMLQEKNILEERAEDAFDVDNYLKNNVEHMLNSISGYIKYYNSREGARPIQKIYLSGTGAFTYKLADYISSKFGIATERLRAEKGIVNKDKRRPDLMENLPEVTIGAAFYDFNLLPREVVENQKHREKTRLVILLNILVLVGFSSILLIPLNQIQELQREKKMLAEQIALCEQVEVLKNEYDALLKGYQVRENVMKEADTKSDHLLAFLESLEKHMPVGITLQSLSSTEVGIVMNCVAEDRLTVARYITVLKSLGMFQTVYTGSLAEAPGTNPEQSVIQFTITCQY